MSQTQPTSPYHPLGQRLKALREQASESLAEASGAVEIDVRQLAGFELGQSRPSEEVLLLLVSHFGAKDDEAIHLWELAGYGLDKIPVAHMSSGAEDGLAPNSANDNRILFTDKIDVMASGYGVVMDFMQNGRAKDKATSVARIGMSREHAKSVMKILQLTLAQTEIRKSRLPNKLPSSD